MKRAIGELNLTVVVLVVIAAMLGFFMVFKDRLFRSVMSPVCCVLNKGSIANGTCDVDNTAGYYDCMGQAASEPTSSEDSAGSGFLGGSEPLSNGSIIKNIKDSNVAKSINSELSVSSNINTKNDDHVNHNLDKNTKSVINGALSNTKGNSKGETSGVYKGSPAQIEQKLKQGFNTKGDYTNSKVTSTTSNYSSKGDTYTTTTIVTSNTSNYKLRVTTTYTRNSNGDYEISSVEWSETSTSIAEANGKQY